jgi:hypothetical protein
MMMDGLILIIAWRNCENKWQQVLSQIWFVFLLFVGGFSLLYFTTRIVYFSSYLTITSIGYLSGMEQFRGEYYSAYETTSSPIYVFLKNLFITREALVLSMLLLIIGLLIVITGILIFLAWWRNDSTWKRIVAWCELMVPLPIVCYLVGIGFFIISM